MQGYSSGRAQIMCNVTKKVLYLSCFQWNFPELLIRVVLVGADWYPVFSLYELDAEL